MANYSKNARTYERTNKDRRTWRRGMGEQRTTKSLGRHHGDVDVDDVEVDDNNHLHLYLHLHHHHHQHQQQQHHHHHHHYHESTFYTTESSFVPLSGFSSTLRIPQNGGHVFPLATEFEVAQNDDNDDNNRDDDDDENTNHELTQEATATTKRNRKRARAGKPVAAG